MTTRNRLVGLTVAAVLLAGLAAFLIARVSLPETGFSPTGSSPPATATPTTSLPPAVPAPTRASTASASEPRDDNAHDAEVENERVWEPVVTNFGRNFTNTADGNGPWSKRLIGDPARPFVTTAVAKQLTTVDVRNVPAGTYESYEVVQSSTFEVAVKVDYDQGWSTVLYLNTDGVSWQIYAYDRYEE